MKNYRFDHVKQFLKEILFPEEVFCPHCHKLFTPDHPKSAEGLCSDCATDLRSIALDPSLVLTDLTDLTVASAFPYEGIPRNMVLQLKHNSLASAGSSLVPFLVRTAETFFDPSPETVVTWIAMPPDRLRERGIDHGRVLAEGVASTLGLECRQLLDRLSGGHTQQGLNAVERARNISGRFSIHSTPLPSNVLIVDDVLTTGSTVEECAAVLTRAGVTCIRALTVCKVILNK